MSILRLTPEQLAAHQKRVRREPPIAGEANAQDRPIQKAQQGPKTGAGRDFPASGVQSPKKYRNRPTGAYSSGKEARRAAELKLLEKAGEIRNLREQVPFMLIQAQYVDGKLVEHACRYVADFVYEEPHASLNGQIGWWRVVEDCKGVRTKDYVIKRKLMLYVHGIRVRET